ncbi:hypothetical protein KAR91_27480 [Candidatus Pacearchaeota archaeon]|nr:hypothetical protein [Candidatus Pacearchaeota archaeon]
MNIVINYIENDELPHRVEFINERGIIQGAGTTLEGAILRVISLVRKSDKKAHEHQVRDEDENGKLIPLVADKSEWEYLYK